MSTPKPPSTPVPERSLNRQLVLDEDEYTAALSHIIARDFFPSLVHLDATNDYLDALHSRDSNLIHASVRRLQDLSDSATTPAQFRTPAQTPYGAGPSETPLRTPRGDGPAKRPRYDTDLSLDSFQARYTSEDNSSFTQILDDENRKRKERWTWAWDAQRRVEQQRERMLEGRERSLIEAPPAVGVREKFMIETPTPAGLITDGREGELEQGEGGAVKELAVQESEKEKEIAPLDKHKEIEKEQTTVDVMAPKKDTRSAGVDGWKFKTRNALMFPPDADISPYDPLTTAANPSDPKAIKHGNTRLPEQDDSSSNTRGFSAPPSPTRSRIDAAIQGTPYRPRSPNSSSSFPLVPSLPSPTPSELGPAAVKELMTWGTLTATPRILSASDDPAEPPRTPFHLPAPSARENISHKLSNNASKSLRAKAGLLGGGTPGVSRTSSAARKGSMPPPSWTPRRADAPGNLTPAARRLLDRTTMGTAAARRAEAMSRAAGWEGNDGKARDKDLARVRWTPTPSPVTRR